MDEGYRCRHCRCHYRHWQVVSDGKQLPADGEGHHAEEVHPQEEEEGERARVVEHPQDKEHHRDEEHHREEGEEEVHPREYRRPHLDNFLSLAEWHHLAGEP